MISRYPGFCALLVTPLLLGSTAFADEDADAMIEAALPVMYHSCSSVIETADGDEAYVLDVVEKITAVSLINRAVDITEFANDDADEAKLHTAFVEAIGVGCAGDPDALLAGVIDNAVKSALGL